MSFRFQALKMIPVAARYSLDSLHLYNHNQRVCSCSLLTWMIPRFFPIHDIHNQLMANIERNLSIQSISCYPCILSYLDSLLWYTKNIMERSPKCMIEIQNSQSVYSIPPFLICIIDEYTNILVNCTICKLKLDCQSFFL